MKTYTFDTAILGAGLAGLSAAYHTGFPVFEKRNEPGGTAGSVRRSGYTFDYGIHVIHSKDPLFHEFMETIGLKFVSHNRRGLIYSHGAYAAYPFQVNTSHLPIKIRMKCVLGYLLKKKRKIHNYEDWILENFGTGFGRHFLIPYSEKFWGISPREMTHEWTGQQRVPMPGLMDVIKGAIMEQKDGWGPNSQFIYPAEKGAGFAGIPDAMAAKIDPVNYGMKVTAFDLKNKALGFHDGEAVLEYDQLISTIPLPEYLSLIPALPEDVRPAIGRLRHNAVAIVNIGIDRPDINVNHWIHYPDEGIPFFRISFPDNFGKGLSPESVSMIQAEVSYPPEAPPDGDQLVEKVHQSLIDAGIVQSSDRIVFKDVVYKKYGYVIYDRHRKAAADVIRAYLEGHDIYCCGRYGEWGYLWADEAVKSGRLTAERLKKITVGQGG